jgi:guanylate kinase
VKTVFLVVGESASGKDSVVNLLEQEGYKVLKSYTTRPRRTNEGNTHKFITPSEVEQFKDDMIAYTKIGSYEYFSTIQQLKESDIYVIDPKGIEYLKSKITDINIIVIYINVPIDERIHRARDIRKDNPQEILNRFNAEKKQFDKFKLHANYDYSVSNVDLNKAYKIVKNIIQIEGDN